MLGHEFSGVVAELGSKVENFHIGDRVAGAPLIPCEVCVDCLKGNYSLCRHYTFIRSRLPGAFAQYVVLPAKNLIKFSPTVPFEIAAFFEPATVALHGIFCNEFTSGGHVAVFGGGTIGMFVMQWAKILGAKSVTVFDIKEQRLTLAQGLGCDNTVNPKVDDVLAKTHDITNKRGFDYIFETAGADQTMKMAFEIAGNKAKICFIGTPTKDMLFTPQLFENLNRKEFKLTGSWMSYSKPFPGKEWEMTAKHFSNGQLKIAPAFIYKKYPLSKAAEAFQEFINPQNITGKILLINN